MKKTRNGDPMPWLFIDTAAPDHFRFGTVGSESIRVRSVAKRVRGLLVEIHRIFSIQELARFRGICVVHGPGSFSSVRGGVLVANLLARLLKKPLIGVGRDEADDLRRLPADLDAGRIASSAYVMPTYDAEPNITVSTCPH